MAHNTELVIAAMFEMGADTKYVHIEDIAHAAWVKTPTSFGWDLSRYNYPDKNSVYEALKRLKKAGLVYQNNYTWMLSQKAIGQRPTKTATKQFDKVRKSALFKLYTSGSIKWNEEHMFRDLLNVSADSNQRIANSEFQSLLSEATSLKDTEVAEFLMRCSNKFESVVGG